MAIYNRDQIKLINLQRVFLLNNQISLPMTVLMFAKKMIELNRAIKLNKTIKLKLAALCLKAAIKCRKLPR